MTCNCTRDAVVAAYQEGAKNERQKIEAEQRHVVKHAVHAARCQLIEEIKAAFVPYDKLTAEQVVSLLSGDDGRSPEKTEIARKAMAHAMEKHLQRKQEAS